MQCDIVMFLARRVVDAALLSSSVHDCYGCAEDFDSILLSDDDTKFEEILLGSHTHTHTPSPVYFLRQHCKCPFFTFFYCLLLLLLMLLMLLVAVLQFISFV